MSEESLLKELAVFHRKLQTEFIGAWNKSALVSDLRVEGELYDLIAHEVKTRISEELYDVIAGCLMSKAGFTEEEEVMG